MKTTDAERYKYIGDGDYGCIYMRDKETGEVYIYQQGCLCYGVYIYPEYRAEFKSVKDVPDEDAYWALTGEPEDVFAEFDIDSKIKIDTMLRAIWIEGLTSVFGGCK